MDDDTNDTAAVLGRRTLMKAGVAAMALVGTSGTAAALAAQQSGDTEPAEHGSRPRRIDTHHHATPPELQDWLVRQGILPPDQTHWPRWARWDVESTLAVMDANGIEAGVASTPAPFDIFADEAQAKAGARVCNEALAAVVREHPTRFGFFAYLPLPYVEASIDEAAYALDELKADGVLMMTHAGEHYLGDPVFDPVFDELNRRRAVVFTHPLGIPGGPAPGVEDYLADFLLDTTRAALRMIIADTLGRYPDVSVILSHGGGFLPYSAGRLDVDAGVPPERVAAALRRFYYDTALPTSPYATPSLLAAASPERLLFGTDWNQNTEDGVARYVAALDEDRDLDQGTRRRIYRDNARRLLPDLAARLSP
jgi:6-methylsalicylate decarboxylase